MIDAAIGSTSLPSEAADIWQPRLVGFLCNWCSFAGADMAGTSRLGYPSAIRIIRVPCTGRVDPLFVAKAFQEGADGVLVAGCHPGDCHYSEGNYHMRRRYAMLKQFLTFLGVEEGRLRLEWVSASEGKKFARVITEFTAQVTALGPRKGETSAAGRTAGGLP
jgi:F420-non-reducing hydrogenase iron-sulfur subunit